MKAVISVIALLVASPALATGKPTPPPVRESVNISSQAHAAAKASAAAIAAQKQYQGQQQNAVGIGQGGAGGRARATANNSGVTQNVFSGSRDRLQAAAVFAPTISAGNCRNPVSGGFGAPGIGLSLGFTTRDGDCNWKEYSQMLWAMGYRVEAIHVLSNAPEVNAAFRSRAAYSEQGFLIQQPAVRKVYRKKTRRCRC